MDADAFYCLHQELHGGETVHPKLEGALGERAVEVDLEDVDWVLAKGSKHDVTDLWGRADFMVC